MSRWLVGDRVKKMKPLLLSMYGATCAKCGKPIDTNVHYPDPYSMSIGHQIPLSRGGSDDISNLRPEHLGCNTSAGNRLPYDARMPDGDARFF